MARALTRRRWVLAGGASAVAGAAAWRMVAAPPLPALDARPLGELILLRAPRGGLTLPTFGLQAAARDPHPPPTRAALEDPQTAPVLGAGAPTVVALLDFRCPACRRHAADWLRLAARDRIRFIARDWPILGAASVLAARAALAAERQGAYWPFFRRLMATRFVPTMGLVRDLAQDAGLDVASLVDAMAGSAVRARLTRNAALAAAAAAAGTPTYVADGVIVQGGYDAATVLALARHHGRG